MNERNPTPMAEMLPLMSQLSVAVQPTAAVAAVPRDPTMAISIYCTAVSTSSSSMVGPASERMPGTSSQCSFLFPAGTDMRASIEKNAVRKGSETRIPSPGKMFKRRSRMQKRKKGKSGL